MTTFTHREIIPVAAAASLGADGCAGLAVRHAHALMDGIDLRVDSTTERVVLGTDEIDCTLGVARECGMSVDAVAVLVRGRF
jgi:hypothetical protein